MVTSTYRVQGMTCSHCAQAVTTEVGAIEGVEQVRVDVTAGEVTVDSIRPLDPATVGAAVDEAGYTLVTA